MNDRYHFKNCDIDARSRFHASFSEDTVVFCFTIFMIIKVANGQR